MAKVREMCLIFLYTCVILFLAQTLCNTETQDADPRTTQYLHTSQSHLHR